MVFVVLLSTLKEFPGWYLKLGQDCFVPLPSQFIYAVLVMPYDSYSLSRGYSKDKYLLFSAGSFFVQGVPLATETGTSLIILPRRNN